MQTQSQTKRVGYEALANAIVKRAADDYVLDLRILAQPAPGADADVETVTKYEVRKARAQRRIDETEQIFTSDWFRTLADVDGAWLMTRLRKVRRGRRKC